MSLPTATKDISDHPAKGSVVDPVDSAKKEADVDRKLRLFGVINAFRDGRMPDNSQIDETLTYVLQHSPVDEKSLSSDGRRLISDCRDIIETARLMVKEKNADEVFQNFVWHTRDTDFDRAKKDPTELSPIDKEKARADNQEAVRHLRTLLSLLLTNSEARKLVSDFSLIGRDLLAKGASKAAQNIAPTEEQLRGVDESAPHDQFITEGGRKIGPNEGTPVPEMRVPGTDTTVSQHPNDPVGKVPTNSAELAQAIRDPSGAAGANATVRHGDGTVRSGEDAMTEGRERTREAGQQAVNTAQAEGQDVANKTGGVPETDEEKEVGKRSLFDKMRDYRDKTLDRVPDERKDQAREHRDRAHRFITEEYFPEERRDQFIYRGKKVIVECQKHNDYQEAIKWLIGYVEEYARHGKTVANHGKDSHDRLREDDSLGLAGRELRTLLERFANGQSTDIIWNAMNQLIDDSRNDKELREWFSRVDTFIRKTLLEPGFVLEPQCNKEAKELRESGRQFYDGKYKNHFDNMFNSVSTFFRAMSEDPLNKRFGDDWARLTKDLLFDSEGSLKFKQDLWMDVRKVILPTLVDQVGFVPIPRVEYTDETLDLVIENLTLSGRNLFPNIVAIEAHNHLKFSPYSTIKDESHHEFKLTLGQMQADMRDVAFWFHKKSGFPKLSDSGLADVLLGGEGLTATVHLASAEKDRSSVFKVKSVNVKVDTLKFSIRDSKHDLLYKTLKPLATGLIKKQIQKAIQNALVTGFEYLDGQLVGVRDRMSEAKSSDESTRAEVLKEMFQRKKDQAESVKSGSEAKFNVVSKRDSLLLPGHGSPSGWINRANERAEAATTGKDWRSEAFTIIPGKAAPAGSAANANAATATRS